MNEPIVEKRAVYSGSNRVGKFNILSEIIGDGRERPMLQALFALCVVLIVDDHESGRGKTYIAASDLFQPLSEGEEIPDYRIEVAWPDQDFGDPEREKDFIRSGQFRFSAVRQIIVRVPPLSIQAAVAVPGRLH